MDETEVDGAVADTDLVSKTSDVQEKNSADASSDSPVEAERDVEETNKEVAPESSERDDADQSSIGKVETVKSEESTSNSKSASVAADSIDDLAAEEKKTPVEDKQQETEKDSTPAKDEVPEPSAPTEEKKFSESEAPVDNIVTQKSTSTEDDKGDAYEPFESKPSADVPDQLPSKSESALGSENEVEPKETESSQVEQVDVVSDKETEDNEEEKKSFVSRLFNPRGDEQKDDENTNTEPDETKEDAANVSRWTSNLCAGDDEKQSHSAADDASSKNTQEKTETGFFCGCIPGIA